MKIRDNFRRGMLMAVMALAAATSWAYINNALVLGSRSADGRRVAGNDSITVIVTRQDAPMQLQRVPKRQISALSSQPGVTGVYGGHTVVPLMDKARPVGRVDVAQTKALGHGGRGVIAGIVDLGFDPHHGAFLDANGQCRVKFLRNSRDSIHFQTTSPEKIAEWTTDDPAEYHATHVMGIMAGAKGQYRGVAPECDIAVATGIDEDADILASLDSMTAFARQQGQPIVINLSLGNNLGPHDGTDPFTRYLDSIAAEVPIVVSAGNWGSAANLEATMRYSAVKPYWQGPLLQSADWNGIDIESTTELWCDTSSPIDMQLRVCDDQVMQWVDTIDIEWETGPDSSLTWQHTFGGPYFTGTIKAVGSLAPYNQRYYITVDADIHSLGHYRDEAWSRYWLGILVHPHDDTSTIRAFADAEGGMLLSRGAVEGCVSMSEELTISSMACGHNTTSVGSMVSRGITPVWGGSDYPWHINTQAVSPWSSYGTLADGRHLPHFCAPGEYIVAPYSGRHVDLCGGYPEWPLIAAFDGEDYYVAIRGTSMSSPYVAGVYALWLAEDPTLTPAQLRQRAIDTANAQWADIADPRWGAGCIDAMYGQNAGVDDTLISADVTLVAIYGIDGKPIHYQPSQPGIYLYQYRRADESTYTVKSINNAR